MQRRSLIFAGFLLAHLVYLSQASTLQAAPGDPLAVRKWPGGVISIETHWGFELVIDADQTAIKKLPRPADQSLSTTEPYNHYLSRKPNTAKPIWTPAAKFDGDDPNAVHVQTLDSQNDKPGCLLLKVDGVTIGYFSPAQMKTIGALKLDELRKADLLVLASDDPSQLTDSQLVAQVKSLAPKKILLNHLGPNQKDVAEQFRQAIGSDTKLIEQPHNTLALSYALKESEPTQVVLMADQPWKMPQELAELFDKMDKSSGDSQKVFAKLSARQLNFRPSNGTHTPRWNTEHMMGRQLLFFSQIYHAGDPTIPVMDLNPKQMPPDYVAAHPDWDGREEARQTQRVTDFTRRFAYLLEGLDLDKKAPDSRWTPRGLLEQMDRHYSEHTANTIKKFDLPDWPKE